MIKFNKTQLIEVHGIMARDAGDDLEQTRACRQLNRVVLVNDELSLEGIIFAMGDYAPRVLIAIGQWYAETGQFR